MKLEQQVCSLELSKKLKELGVKQESLFYWARTVDLDSPGYKNFEIVIFNHPDYIEPVSAFTVAELGDMLPDVVFYEHGAEPLDYGKSEQGWWCSYKSHTEQADTEADARARMIIYLIKNNLYEPNN